MAELIGIAAGAAGGGLFGVFGTALGRLAGYFERRQTIAHEEKRWQHEVQLLELQRLADAAETEAELALEHAAGRWAGLQASLNADAAIRGSYPWVDAVRGLTPDANFALVGDHICNLVFRRPNRSQQPDRDGVLRRDRRDPVVVRRSECWSEAG